jgi:hypothetical protein
VTYVPPAVCHLAERLDDLGWVTDLLVAGSLATGDYVPGVSDFDLVALTARSVRRGRRSWPACLASWTRGPLRDWTWAACRQRLDDLGVLHPTWTHGLLVQRILSR